MAQGVKKGYIADPRPRPPRLHPDMDEEDVRWNIAKNFKSGKSDHPRAPPGTTKPPIIGTRSRVPLKIVIFLMYGGMAALYPFFTLHMKSLGITIKETAVISFLLPILSCVAVPLVGALADKLGHYKWIILGLTAGQVFCHLLLLGIPSFRMVELFGREEVQSIKISLPCQSRQNAIFFIERQETRLCDPTSLSLHAANELQIDSCSTDCLQHVEHGEPNVCFMNSTGRERYGPGHYCPKWTEMEGQVLKDLSFVSTAERVKLFDWEVTKFRNDEGALLRSAHCYLGPAHSEAHERPNCAIFCQATATFLMQCRISVAREGSIWLTLVAYFVLRLLGLIGLLSVFVILDTVTLQLARDTGATFGSHRILPTLSYIVFPVVSGLLTWAASHSLLVSDFFPAFILFGGLSVIAALVGLFINLPVTAPQVKLWNNAGNWLCNAQIIAVTFIMMVLGLAAGYSTSFLFWFLEYEFGMPKYLMGVGVALANLLAIPVFLAVQRFIHVIGYANLLVIALLMNGLRFLAYSYLFDANLYFPIEILTAIVLGIIYAVPTYFSQLMPPAYFCTVQTVIMVAMFGLGAGIGPFIGGYTIAGYSHRVSFRIFATLFLIIAIIYLLLHCLILRKIKLPTVIAPEVITRIQVPPVELPSDTSTVRNSELYPDETEAILYREKISPLAELDRGFQDPIYLYGSRPVSGVRPFM